MASSDDASDGRSRFKQQCHVNHSGSGEGSGGIRHPASGIVARRQQHRRSASKSNRRWWHSFRRSSILIASEEDVQPQVGRVSRVDANVAHLSRLVSSANDCDRFSSEPFASNLADSTRDCCGNCHQLNPSSRTSRIFGPEKRQRK